MKEGWVKVSLSELGFVGRGKSRHRPRNADFLFGDKYPFIQTGDVKAANYKITSYTTMYSDDGLKQSKLWPKDTLCITIAANIADSALLGLEACFPDSIIGFIADEKKSDVRFVKYLFDLLQVRIKQISQGAAQDNLSVEKLETIKFDIPPVPKQRKIASILSGYDDLIENNLKRIKLLEEKAQLTYEEWFVKMRFPGYETAVFDEVSGMPEGWEKVKLIDCCELIMGQSPKSEYYNDERKGLPFHQGVKDYGFRFPTNTSWSTDGNRIANENDILFSVRAPVGRLNVAIDKIILGRGLAAIRHKKNFNSFTLYQLQNVFFKDNLMGGGAIFNSVTKKDVENITIVISSEDIMKSFETIVSKIDKNIKNLTIQNRLLKEARDLLLPRLMSGMVDVEALEIGNLEIA